MVITKNSSNIVTLTLDEKATLTNHDWIIQFTNCTTGKSKTKLVTDVSSFPTRYNKFVIVEPTDVELSPSGQWTYSVYEVPLSSPPINDISQAVKVVETGICDVKESTTVVTFTDGEAKNNGVFDVE
jgi:hypothetical protein